jgi:Ca2+/Na+ antiporter
MAEQDQSVQKSRALTIAMQSVSSLLILIEWIIGIALVRTPSEYFHEPNFKSQLWDRFLSEMGSALGFIVIVCIVNVITVLLIMFIVNRIKKKRAQKAKPEAVAEPSTNKKTALKKSIYSAIVLLEWIFALWDHHISLLSVLIILLVNVATAFLVVFLFGKGSKEKMSQRLKAIKEWCGKHIGWTIAIVLFLIALFVWAFVDTDNIVTRRSEERIEKSLQSGDPAKVMDAVRRSVDYNDLYNSHSISSEERYSRPLYIITQLIESGNINAAIYFYENKTYHCANDDLDNTWGDQYQFSQKACQLIYGELIKQEKMDEAWNYHLWNSDTSDSYSNAECYYNYMIDVINHYCGNDNKAEATRFMKQHVAWFVKNVDNSDSKYAAETKAAYSSEKVKQQMALYIENY